MKVYATGRIDYLWRRARSWLPVLALAVAAGGASWFANDLLINVIAERVADRIVMRVCP